MAHIRKTAEEEDTFGGNVVRALKVVRARADVVTAKLILSFSFFFPSTYFSPRRGFPRKLKFGW